MQMYNSEKVKKTLYLVIQILEKHKVEYRLLGSIVSAAIIGKQHRNLGDIDLIVDRTKREIILDELHQLGYFQRDGMFAFSRKYLDLDSLVHETYLEVGMFWGVWSEKKDFVIGTVNNGVKIDAKALIKTKYMLHDVFFYGLPKEVIARGLLMSSKNPKRQFELSYFKQHHIHAMDSNYIHTSVMGMKVDFIYYLGMQILNIIGFFRVIIGKPFDPWR
ncbi:hypothetical protein KAZ66_05680 [Candidatus Woesebacteria bacterium]|nr:hypothetical protein [Candidatus Woesebacteria bacterium]